MDSLLAATQPAIVTVADSMFGDGLVLMVVGMLVVFTALAVLGGLVVLLEKASDALDARAGLAPPERDGGIDPHHLVVIAAAAAASINRPIELRHVAMLAATAAITTDGPIRTQVLQQQAGP
ncbi:MAG: hypothetical protein KAS72_00090 [Phycisphaerales bacterium]|nr:hypothetical protein [Phycisphaerales bacterium]